MTRALLEQIVGGEQGERLRRQLAVWNDDASPDEIEDALQEACARAERSCCGQVEGAVYAWLRTTAHRELARQRRRRKSEPIIDVDLEDIEVPDATAPGADMTIMAWADRVEASHAASVVLDRLSERQRDVVALHARGLHRRQIAEHLRLTPRTVKRLMEQVLAIGRDELVRLAGNGCDTGERLVSRLAFGLADAGEARRAQLHLATCGRCGALYERLAVWRENVAALLPVPPVAASSEQTVERAVQIVSDAVSTSAPSGGETPAGGHHGHVGDIGAWLREQAIAFYYRTVDPTPLAGARPGAVAAAVAGCIAVGGGATYCAQQVGDPLSALSGLAAAPKAEKVKPDPRPARAAAAQVQPVAARVVTPAPMVAPPPPPPPVAAPPPPPAAPEEEFEPSSTPARTVASRPRASSGIRKPMPAPKDGPPEFGGP